MNKMKRELSRKIYFSSFFIYFFLFKNLFGAKKILVFLCFARFLLILSFSSRFLKWATRFFSFCEIFLSGGKKKLITKVSFFIGEGLIYKETTENVPDESRETKRRGGGKRRKVFWRSVNI